MPRRQPFWFSEVTTHLLSKPSTVNRAACVHLLHRSPLALEPLTAAPFAPRYAAAPDQLQPSHHCADGSHGARWTTHRHPPHRRRSRGAPPTTMPTSAQSSTSYASFTPSCSPRSPTSRTTPPKSCLPIQQATALLAMTPTAPPSGCSAHRPASSSPHPSCPLPACTMTMHRGRYTCDGACKLRHGDGHFWLVPLCADGPASSWMG